MTRNVKKEMVGCDSVIEMGLPSRSGDCYVLMSNPFTEQTHFPNIHSLRLCLQSLSLAELKYPELTELSESEIVTYFKKQDLEDPDFLKTYVSIDDYAKFWGGNNQRKARFDIKSFVNKARVAEFVLSASINPIDAPDRFISVFSEISIENDRIAAWFTPSVMPFLINPTLNQQGFTRTLLVQLQPLRSVATVKLFNQILRFKDNGVLYLTPKKLQALVQSKTDNFNVLNRDVIKKASRDLVNQGLISKAGLVVVPVKKDGKKIISFAIKFKLTAKALG